MERSSDSRVASVSKRFDRVFISLSFSTGMNLSVSTENFVTRYVNLTISVRTTFPLEMRKDFRRSYATLIYLLALLMRL